MIISTHLISGAGNTFHIAWKTPAMEISKQQHLVKIICKKNTADGFIFLNQENNCFTWDFYNNDGSVAEMCGNATRCVGFYIKNILHSPAAEYQLQTFAGLIIIKALSTEKFEVQMTQISELKSKNYFFCDSGVPHLVIEINDFENYKDHFQFCKNLRFDSEFAPRGTNVTLISKSTAYEKIKAVSYERGVEDFTPACGTGAAAVAFYNLKKNACLHTTVQMPGGDLDFNLENINRPIMTGPAILLGEYLYDIEI